MCPRGLTWGQRPVSLSSSSDPSPWDKVLGHNTENFQKFYLLIITNLLLTFTFTFTCEEGDHISDHSALRPLFNTNSLNTKLKRCYTLAIVIPKFVMLVIGAHSAMSHWSDVLSGILQGSIFGPILCITKDTTIFDNCRNQHNIIINITTERNIQL